MGFILAASGSAIGLGNIVVFSGNAYKYGGGAFYLPYFIALFCVGIPVMVLEFGLGGMTRKSFPLAMRQVGGRFGGWLSEWVGWFAILNAGFISMWYVTLLAWVVGMGVGAFHQEVFVDTTTVEWAGREFAGPQGYFFNMIAGWLPVGFVVIVWILNIVLTSRGTKTIEAAVKVFVPLMWIAMIVLVVQGFRLDGGFDGVKVLFTPELEALKDVATWRGATSQILFTLSLGFGVMTAYASYLPKDADHAHNAITTSLLNCGFEWIAGVAIFSILFVYAIAPSASTIAMMYFTVPRGIGALPIDHQIFGVAFFALLLIAGLTSSISLVEALVAAMRDKFGTSRGKVLVVACSIGAVGSIACTLPQIIDGGLAHDGTLGFTILDLLAHWSFDTGLLIVAILECLVVGWLFGSHKLRRYINEGSRFQLVGVTGLAFDLLIRFLIPGALAYILYTQVVGGEFGTGADGARTFTPYGHDFALSYTVDKASTWHAVLDVLPQIVLGVWVVGSVVVAMFLAFGKARVSAPSATPVGGVR